MNQLKFPVPDDIDQALKLLNLTSHWSLSFIDENKVVHGWFADEGLLASVHDQSFSVSDGEKLMFTAATMDEAKAFIYGCFLATFEGNSIEAISNKIRKNEHD